MYHYGFKEARNFKGKLYRNQETGDLIEYCHHNYIICPSFGSDTEFYANFIPIKKETFEGFRMICDNCGEMIFINKENVVKDETEQYKLLEEAIKENKDCWSKNKKNKND